MIELKGVSKKYGITKAVEEIGRAHVCSSHAR